MLARRLTTILPAMTLAEAIETTWMPRAAGRIGERTALVTRAPEGTAHCPLLHTAFRASTTTRIHVRHQWHVSGTSGRLS